MSVFVWLTPFRALAKRNQCGIDKDYGPTGHSGCAEESGLALAAGTETYILRHSGTHVGTQRHTQAHTHKHLQRERQTYIASTRGGSESKPL